MPEPTSQVVAADSQSVSEPETTPAAGVAEQTTPSQQPPADVEKLRVEYEQKLQAASRDINQLKSTLQKQVNQKDQEWQKRYSELQQQFREVRLGTMDETQRKQYEAQMATEEVNNLRQQLQEAQSKQAEIAAIADAKDFFLQKGVPLSKLVIDQGYEALVQSGWDDVSERLNRYENQATNQPKSPAPLQTAPNVVTDKSTPTTGASWAELVKKFGSEERVFQLAEQGSIDLSNVTIPPIV